MSNFDRSSVGALLVIGLTAGGCHLVSKVDDLSYTQASSSTTGSGSGSASASDTSSTGTTSSTGATSGGAGGSGGSSATGAGGSGGSGGSSATGAGGSGGSVPALTCDADMVLIPAGEVTLGDDLNIEKAGTVKLPAFCIDRTEVTVAAYQICVQGQNCFKTGPGGYCNAGVAGREKHPINCVTRPQAKVYCEVQGRRLPAEEEWEYAARGTDGRLFPWGNDAPSSQLCWNRFGGGKPNMSCETGMYPTGDSPFGLHDMAGNLAELTASKKDANSTSWVVRGGTWATSDPLLVRAANRVFYLETEFHGDLGFRCAASPKP